MDLTADILQHMLNSSIIPMEIIGLKVIVTADEVGAELFFNKATISAISSSVMLPMSLSISTMDRSSALGYPQVKAADFPAGELYHNLDNLP